MKIKTFSVILLILAIMLPFSASADTLYLNGVITGNINSGGSVYISPYLGGLNGPSDLGNMYCVDPDSWSYIGTHWDVNKTQVDTNTDLGNTYLKNGGRVQYEEIAWLLFYTGYTGKGLTDRQDIQAAIWYIVNPLSPYAYSSHWVSDAVANYGSGNYSQVFILTQTSGAGTYYNSGNQLAGYWNNQEFMIGTAVPEPSALLLLGSGLVGLWGFRRRFRK